MNLRFESTVTGIFMGHTHNDEFQLSWDATNNSRAVGVAYIAPSLSSDGEKSPSFRIYEIDGPDGSWVGIFKSFLPTIIHQEFKSNGNAKQVLHVTFFYWALSSFANILMFYSYCT
jgi:hypothetical protein